MKTKLLSFIVIIYLNGSYSQNPIIKTFDWNTGCMTSVNIQNNHNIGVSVYDIQEYKMTDFNNNLNNVNELKV